MSVLLALNNEAYVCRKVCHPMCCVIRILTAAGRIIIRIRHCPQYGFRPRAAGLANTQSSALLYQKITVLAPTPNCHSDDDDGREKRRTAQPPENLFELADEAHH